MVFALKHSANWKSLRTRFCLTLAKLCLNNLLQEFVLLRYLSYRESLLYSNFITFFLLFLYSNNRAIQPGDSPYLVVKDSITFTESSFDVHLLNKKSNVLLNLKLQTLQNNTARFRITEVNPIRPRYEVKDVLIKEPVTIRWGLTYMHYNWPSSRSG